MQGRIEITNGVINAKIHVEIMKEGEKVIVYTHTLDICGYGSNAEEAKKDFDTAVRIFFEETSEHETLDKALEELGWKKVVVPTGQYWEPQTEVIGSAIVENRIPA